MVEIADAKSVRTWLKNRPPKISACVTVRSALRVMPFLDRAFVHNNENAERLALASFRTLALAWVASSEYDSTNERLLAACETASEAVAKCVDDLDSSTGSKTSPAYFAALSALYATTTASGGDDFGDGVLSASQTLIEAVGTAAKDSILREIKIDASWIEGGENAEILPLRPLFYQGSNKLVTSIAAEEWPKLEKSLSSLGRGWEFWIHWYRDRLLGRSRNPAFENALLTLTGKEWEQDSAAVNERLTELKAEFQQNEESGLVEDLPEMGFRSGEQLMAWLETQPHEVACNIARRAALRVLPFLPASNSALLFTYTDVLRTFQLLSTARAHSNSHQSVEFALVSADLLTRSRGTHPAVALAAANAMNTAISELRAPRNAVEAVENASRALMESINARPQAEVAVELLWRGVSIDAEIYSSGVGDVPINAATLWPGAQFSFARENWERLSARLIHAGHDWEVWIDWYQGFLDGLKESSVFQNAIDQIHNELWEQGPGPVNARLKELMAVARNKQKPAVSVFDVINGKVEGAQYPIRRSEYGQIADDIYAELKRQLEKYAKRLKGFDDHPTTAEILDDIEHIATSLGASITEARPGRLSQQLEFLKVASIRMKSAVHQQALPRELIDVLPALESCMRRFLGLFDDDLRLIDARAEAIGIRAQDFERIEQRLDALVRLAEKSTLVAQSALDALQAGFDEKARLTEAINLTGKRDDEQRAELSNRRALEQGREIRNQENFAECVKVEALKEDEEDESVGKKIEVAVSDGMADAVKETVSEAGQTGLKVGFKVFYEAVKAAIGL